MAGNTEGNKNDKILSFNTLSTENSPQPLQIDNENVKLKCKLDTVQSKLLNISQELSTIDSISVTNTQLESGQYLNIFNRYQVLNTIIITNNHLCVHILNNYYLCSANRKNYLLNRLKIQDLCY